MDMEAMQEMLAQAQQVSEAAGEQLAKLTVEGSAGGGAVHVRMTGKKEVLGVSLEPAALAGLSGPEDREMLEDLLRAAFNDAGRRADEAAASNMSGMLGGLGLPPGLI